MQRLVTTLITCYCIFLVSGCTSIPDKNWTNLLHANTSFVIIPEQGMKVSDIPAKQYASYLDDLTPGAMQQLAALATEIPNSVKLKALAMYPATTSESQFLWIGEHQASDIEEWGQRFYQPFTQNNYNFNSFIIHKLFFNKTNVFGAQAGKWLILSKSSLVVENALRAYLGDVPVMNLDAEPEAGTLVLNTPHLDKWIEQFAAISSRPEILNSFLGTKPVSLTFETTTDTLDNIHISGTMGLNSDTHSVLTDAFSYRNKPITLDRYIASNAAMFALLRLPPVSIPKQSTAQISALDSLLLDDLDLYQKMAGALEDEFAFVAFQESGLLTTGEYLFMRKAVNANTFKNHLNNLVADGFISRQQSTYHVSSSVISHLIGSELSTLKDFYLSFSGNVITIAKRKGLAESVHSDRTRRRVIYYDETYSSVKAELPDELSGFIWSSSDEFMKFIQPYLKAGNLAGSLINRFDIIAITMSAENNAVDLSIDTYSKEGSTQPYEELWVHPMADFNLSAKPVLGNLVGGSANEIVISTEDGRINVLAADGTSIMETSTNGLQPVGGPILYDWYGNGQPVILLAADNKIFAWNAAGDLLPKFPLELDAKISAPILVTDVLRNGVPELVVATENRKVHVLDGRGEDVRGWPQNTNTTVTSKPVFGFFEDIWSVWAFSENALHSWQRDGTPRPQYPQFINAQFTGSPMPFENQILGSAADGYLYSIGKSPFFADSALAEAAGDEVSIQSVYVSENEISSAVFEENVLLQDDAGNFYREDLIAAQSVNGSLFLYNTNGQLRFTQSLGQPASPTLVPHLVDINADDNMELIGLAEFGRLYAWEVLTNERIYGIPTSGMKYPVVTDLNGDGQKELIAQTREGLRCWTISRQD